MLEIHQNLNRCVTILEAMRQTLSQILPILEHKSTSESGKKPSLRQGGVFSVEHCIDSLILAKSNANRTGRYVKSLGYYLRQFAKGREKTPINQITHEDIECWIAKYPSAFTRRTWLSRLSPLFSFCVRRGWINSNPCDRIERITVDVPPPFILTPERSQKLVFECPENIKPYLILGMFSGIRPEEMMRLDWKAVSFETNTVSVEGKTRRRRYVPMEPVAVSLLKPLYKSEGSVAPSDSTIDRWKLKMRNLFGWQKWPQDVLRHTAASYLIALYNDAGKVALRLGNSAKTLMAHYHTPVPEDDCKRFWDVTTYRQGNDMKGSTA